MDRGSAVTLFRVRIQAALDTIGPGVPDRAGCSQHLVPYRSAFLKGLACVVVAASALQLAAPWVTKYAIDDLVADLTAAKLWRLRGRRFSRWPPPAAGSASSTRRIIVGVSREFEYSLRNEFFAHLQRLDLGYFQRTRTGDLMSRATNDLSAVRMMMGPAVMYTSSTVLTFVVAMALMIVDRSVAHAGRARAAAVRVALRALLRQARFTIASSASRRSSPRSARSRRNRWPASASCAPTARSRSSSARFREANDEYVRRNRALIAPAGDVLPEHGPADGHRRAAGAVAGQPRGACAAGSRSASWWPSTPTWRCWRGR